MVKYNLEKSLKVKPKISFANNVRDREKTKGLCTRMFIEFCKRTDLHGYKYIVMEDLSIFERGFWMMAVFVSIAFAVYFVVTAYQWYARNPIVTVGFFLPEIILCVIESTQGPVWDIPFPAVTICDLNAISRKAARAFADNVTLPDNVTADEVFDISRLGPLLHSSIVLTSYQKTQLVKLQGVLDLNHISIETFFRQLSPAASCSQLVQRCMWKNTVYRCDVLFKQVFTYFSLCCTFNYFAADLDDSKSAKGFERMDNPRRVASCGYQTALTVLISTNADDYYSAHIASQGALVFIDNAFNIPNVDSPVRMINPSTELLIALSPESTYTTSGIKAFKPEERQCYYSDEIRVGDFRQYSFHNCIAFQRVEIIRNACECIPYYFPLKDYHRICNFNDLDCLETTLARHEDVKDIMEQGSLRCLPECEHFDYPIEVALGKLTKNIQLDGLPFFNDLDLENHSLVNVFFNDLVSTRYRRDAYFNWQNLLASFGGLLSLMLGFTLIAGFDLILFFTFGMAYTSMTGPRHDERSKMKLNLKSVKGNKIYIQNFPKEFKPGNMTMINGSDVVNWQTQVRYGNRY